MNSEKINGMLTLDIPEGFRRMSGDDLKQLFRSEEADRWGIQNKECHTVLTVMWKQYPALLSWLADLKTMARKNERMAQKGYAGNEYSPGGFISLSAGGKEMEGYRFSYRVQGIAQSAETVLLKHKGYVYNITFIGRKEDQSANQETFRKILNSLSL